MFVVMETPKNITSLLDNKIVRFIISGGSAAATEYLVFMVLHGLGVFILLANSLSFATGLFISFSLNKLWVFKAAGNGKMQFGSYAILALVNLCISNALLWLAVQELDIQPLIAKLASMALIATWNYLIFSRLIFAKNSNLS